MCCPPLGLRPSSSSWSRGALLALSFALTACPASLANPQDFADRSEFSGDASDGTGGSGAVGGAFGSQSGAAGVGNTSGTPACVVTVFKTTCSGGVCHDPGGNAAGGLDLLSPNVAARLIDQPATHADVGPSDVCPTGDKLIDTSNRSASWLLKKLSASTVGTCGTRMPAVGNLTSVQLSCLQNWVNHVQPGGM